jgi:hypothetical protein
MSRMTTQVLTDESDQMYVMHTRLHTSRCTLVNQERLAERILNLLH